jgi:hypothetical protein
MSDRQYRCQNSGDIMPNYQSRYFQNIKTILFHYCLYKHLFFRTQITTP